MKIAFSYLLVGFLWLLHWLPLPVLRAFGWLLGRLLYIFGRERREVALINLGLCFPEKTEAEREEEADVDRQQHRAGGLRRSVWSALFASRVSST